jgi:hypothetical protein
MTGPRTQPRPKAERMGVRPRRARLPANELALIAEVYELAREGVVSWQEQSRPRRRYPCCCLCRRESPFEESFSRSADSRYWCLDHAGCNFRVRARMFRIQSWSLRQRAERIAARETE